MLRPAHRRRAPCDRCRRSACRPSRRCHGARARRCRRRTALAHGRSKCCFPGPRVELADGGPGVSSMQSKSTRGCPWVCCPCPMVRATSLNVVHGQSLFAMSSREGSRVTAGSCRSASRTRVQHAFLSSVGLFLVGLTPRIQNLICLVQLGIGLLRF